MMTKRLIRISYFTMLTVVGGLLRIPVGSIYFTFQTAIVILSAFILGGNDSFFAQIVYMLLGLCGLPIFTNGGGFSYVFQPTFGYIIAFSVAALLTGKLLYSLKTLSTIKLWLTGVAGLAVIYLIGAVYQMAIFTLVSGLTLKASLFTLISVTIYFAVDLVIVYLIALIYPKLTDLLKLSNVRYKENTVDNV